MWTIGRAKPRHWTLDLIGALSLLAPSERPLPATLALRTAFVVAIVFGVDVLIHDTGGLPSFYSNFYFILLMYAGLSLPLPLALGVTAFAIAGPSHRGLLFLDAIENDQFGVLARPISMVALVLFAGLIARAIRRNVSFYEQLYGAIATHFPNGSISLFDPSLRYLLSGGEGLTKLGLTPDQIVGKQPWDILDPESASKIMLAMHAALEGKAETLELKYGGSDQLVRVTPIYDASGKVVAGLALTQDITELRIAEAAVRESERRTFSFLDSMPVGVFILDSNGRAYYSNKLAVRLLGQGIAPDATSENLSQVYKAFRAGTDEVYPDVQTPIVKALDGKTTMIDDMELDREDGRMAIQVWGTPILDENGAVTYAMAAFSDITAQKRFEAAIRESEERFRAVFEESPLGIFFVGLDGRFIRVNDALCQITGYGSDELLGRPVAEITYPDDANVGLAQRELLLSDEVTRINIEKRYVRKDGQVVWVSLYAAMIRDDSGAPLHSLVMAEDITQRKLDQQEIERLASIVETTEDAIYSYDTNGIVLDWNPGAERLYGYSAEEILGKSIQMIVPDHRRDEIKHLIAGLISDSIPSHYETERQRKDGVIVWVSLSPSRSETSGGEPALSLIARDVTAQHQMEASIQHLAYHDALTGLPNRRLMLDRTDQAIVRAKRYGGELALLSLDLDGFKHVNDEYGHAAGDALLVESSRRLENAIRASDTAARMGGDEFLVLLTEATPADAQIIRERIVQSLARPVFYESQTLQVAVSVGVSIYVRDGCDTDSLIKAADAAMYADKRTHRAARQPLG